MRVTSGCKRQIAGTAAGFTLVEVLLALAIFAIGILALGALQIRYISGNALARNQTESLAVASGVLERLMAMPVQSSLDLSAGSHGPFNVGGHQVTWNITPDSPMEGIQSVVVRVFPNGRNGRTVSVRYYISETVPLSYTIEEDPM
jgi:prepilin-type N-terminal cleavage/methylation domain-containing protein